MLFLLTAALLPLTSQAQCPSVMGTGQPAVAFLSLYGMPHGHYFAEEAPEYRFGVTSGLQIGAILSPGFHLQAGAELSTVNRTIDREQTTGKINTYKTLLFEIPVEMRMRFYTSMQDESQAFFILGAGVMMNNVKETNDSTITKDELMYHQLFVRAGFENAITVQRKFNILWGIIGKADPLALAGKGASNLNGSYYVGAKLGIQFGF